MTTYKALAYLFSVLSLLLAVAAARSKVIGSTAHTDTNPTVIVIGAGMSGIMAAKTLSEKGIDFIILEATNRVGGRMSNTTFQGYTVEKGANWVEGVNGDHVNPIWTLANEYDIRNMYSDYDNVSYNIYSDDGTGVPLEQSVVAPVWDKLSAGVDFSNNLSLAMSANNVQDISILCSQRLFGVVPTSPLEMTIDFYNYDFEVAEPPRITSLLNVYPNPTFEEFGYDEYLVADPRGYVYILHKLAGTFLETEGDVIVDSRLMLNKVVNQIEYSNTSVTVTTEDGSVYTATYAILSASVGVLQSDLIKFKPDLPRWKIRSIYDYDMSIYTKIFMKFNSTFWPVGNGTEFWLHVSERRGYFPFWQHLENAYPGSHMMFATVTDDESRRIEQQTDEETMAEAMVVLRKMFGEDIPDMVDILVPRWWSDRFFKGSYSNWPIGITEANFDQIKAPVDNLYFTGEHTSARYNGYVHGAYYAGIATAQTLLVCIFNSTCGEITSDGDPWDSLRLQATYSERAAV